MIATSKALNLKQICETSVVVDRRHFVEIWLSPFLSVDVQLTQDTGKSPRRALKNKQTKKSQT